MAVTAEFRADTSSFVAEVKKADDALEGLSTTSAKSSKSASQFSDSMNVATGILGAFGVSLGIESLISFGKALVANADALVNLSAKTGLSIEALQKFQALGDDTSVSIDQMASAINQMQNRIAGGDKSAVAALDALGLSFEQFKTLTPEAQFMAIADAISGVEDPAKQVQLAIDLMGKAGLAVLPALKEGFQGVQSSAATMSAATVKSLDEMGDAFGRAGRATMTFASEALASLWEAMTLANTNLNEFKGAVDAASAAAARAKPNFGALVPPGLPTDLDAIYKSLDADAKAIKAADDALKPFNDAMDALSLAGTGWVTVLDTIDGKVVEAIKYYLAAGVSQKALADAYGLTATQIAAVDKARQNELAGLSFEEGAKKRLLEIQALTLKATNDQVVANLKAQQANEAFLKTEMDAAVAAESWWNKTTEATTKTTTATEGATRAAGVFMNQLSMMVTDPRLAAFFGGGPQGAVATTLYSGGQAGITPEMAAAMAAGQFINTAGVGAVHINITSPLGTPQAIAAAVGDALTTRSQATGNRL